MGCFGDNTSTQKTTLPDYINDASKLAVSKATDLAATPFQAYTGEKVASLTPDQNAAFDMIRSIAGTNNPYLSDVEGLYKTFSSTPATMVTAQSVLGGGKSVGNTTIADYMNPYLEASLAPQLQALERSGVKTRQALDASATMDGAFGDARSGVALAQQLRDEMQQRSNIVGTGYNNAFNAAAGLRQGDITNDINTQATNAKAIETALQRAITGGQALQGLDLSQLNRSIAQANALSGAGKSQQETQQAKNTADYQEFLRGQGWSQQQIAGLVAALSGVPKETTTTTTTPNNTGSQLAGTAVGALTSAIFSDRRLKYDIEQVGQTFDGLPIYRFKYKGSPDWQIGLMAQDVEAVVPGAVFEDADGIKMVDLGKALQSSANMGSK